MKVSSKFTHLSPVVGAFLWVFTLSLLEGAFEGVDFPWSGNEEATYRVIEVMLLLLWASGGFGLYFAFQAKKAKPETLLSGWLGGILNASFLMFMVLMFVITVWGNV